MSGSLKAEAKASGDGGFIETSASKVTIDKNATITTNAQDGKTGTWVLDPTDFVVAKTGGDLTGDEVGQRLNSTNIQLHTINSNDGKNTNGKGDIIINDEISWDKNTLTLKAHHDIHINANLNGTGTAKLALEYGQGSSDGRYKAMVDGKETTLDNDYYLDKNTPLKDRTVKVNLPEGKNFSVKKGSDGETLVFDVIHKMPDIVKNADGDWESKFTTHNIAFGKDMDVGFTKNYDGFAGWQLPEEYNTKSGNNYISVWQPPESYEWGRVAGLGHTVNNLTLRSKGEQTNTGLFQQLYLGYIRDIGATNINVVAYNLKRVNYKIGGLVGEADNILNSYATGKVFNVWNNYGFTGGLSGVGYNISNSYAAVSVDSTGYSSSVGGLSGYAINISNSYATGDVSHQGNLTQAGGLMGRGQSISNSYATGDVSSAGEENSTGGLAGSGQSISNSYATGDVSSAGANANTGGLVGSGYNISNSYANNTSIKATGKDSAMGGLIGNYPYNSGTGSNDSFFNQDKHPTLPAIGKYAYGADKSKIVNVTGKTDSELKQKSTFTDAGWDFDKVWYMNDGSMPKLRAFAQTLTVNPTPTPPTAQTTAGVKAPDLSKTYDGKAITSVDDLKKLDGWKDNFDADGLTTGDSVESIFKAGTLTIDETKGDWKGAKDVKEGGYELYPTGTLKDEYQQKYIIEWNKGTLTINPAKLTITAMNNIKPEGDSNPDVSRIGVVVQGLVEGESISDVNLSYSDDKKWQGDISIIRVGEPVFSNGKASNYEITKNHGKLLTVQREYDLKHLENKSEKEVDEIRNLLNSVENEMLLAHAVYGSDSAKKGDADRFYEVWEVKDNQTGIITKELHKLGFENEPKDGTKTYTKKYELLGRGLDYSDGEVRKGDDVYRDGFFSAEYPNGLAMGVYKDTHQDKYFIVFRGTDTGKALSPHDSDGGTNLTQGAGKLPLQYQRAREVVQELIEKYPNRDYTIIGHSLGGGLASFSSIQQNKQIPTVVFNQAQLHENNIPGAVDYMKPYKFTLQYGHELSRYARETFGQVNSYIFDYDILQFGDAANNAYIGNVHKTEWLPHIGNVGESLFGDTRTNDHLMPHVIKTQRLANIVAQNNEITANCQKDCVKLQEHQWTPPAQLKEIDTNRPTKYQKERDNIQRDIAERERKGKDTEKQHNNLAKVTQKLEQAEVTSGKITVVRGNDSWEVGKNGFLDFKFGDVISTENKKATIYFPDGSWIELDKNSSIRIEIDTTSKRPMADQISLIKGKILRKGNKKPE
ncbi:lipase family protein [Moraxella lacunata]|uniref:lipase family protein n=1 Tax=Moraxella lacunata TaxID=477 RepID=UPI0011C033C6|nr:FecR domain-containing protein [Moraxella lacunata]